MVNMNGGGANGLANTAALLGKNFVHFIIFSLNWLIIEIAKGQIISKCLFDVFIFFQKNEQNTSHSSKNKFIRFGKNSRLDKLLSKLTDL